jgi:ABC-type polysaccharide/polyol phosphate export permease
VATPVPVRHLPDAWIVRTPKRSFVEGKQRASTTGWFSALWILTRHEFRARYRGQALGVIWSLLNPVIMMGILSVIFTRVFPSGKKDYPIYVLIGLVVWQFFSSALSAGTTAFMAHAEIIKRTIFPRQLLPLAVMLSFGLNFLIESSVLVLFIPVFPSSFTLSWTLLLAPVVLAFLVLFLAALVLATSVLHVVYRDVAYLVQTALMILYWLTPLIYRLEQIDEPYRTALKCNPLTGVLSALRGCVMSGTPPSLLQWTSIIVPSVVAFGIGWLIFKHYERVVLDHV